MKEIFVVVDDVDELTVFGAWEKEDDAQAAENALNADQFSNRDAFTVRVPLNKSLEEIVAGYVN